MFERIVIENVRNLVEVSVSPAAGANYLFGANGSGKTSVLESLYLLGYGRSFRGGPVDSIIRRGERFCRVVADLATLRGSSRVGLERSDKLWRARFDGDDVAQLSSLFVRVPVLGFEPTSAEALLFDADVRRRFVDWGVFHVEPGLLPVWRNYVRALRQRNASLRGGDHITADAWVAVLAEYGERIHSARLVYFEALKSYLATTIENISPTLDVVDITLRSGWAEGVDLYSAIQSSLERDITTGFTHCGPHRGDLRIGWHGRSFRDVGSRGQAKALALCLVLAQAKFYRDRTGRWPILLFDDPGSELDTDHQSRLADWIDREPVQVWLSGVEATLSLLPRDVAKFHVEQGKVTRLV